MTNLFQLFPDLHGEELFHVQSLTKAYNEEQLLNFANMYRARRKDPNTIMITALLGLVVVAGVHRFILGQIGMGLLYVFTGGLCLIGTIVDLVNYKKLAFEYNQNVANETAMILKGMN